MSTTLSNDYTLPDAALFKVRFPAFDNVDDAQITFIIDECSDHVGKNWRDQDYQPAIMYLVAHFLSVEGEPDRADALAAGGGAAGLIANVGAIKVSKVGDTQTEFFDKKKGKDSFTTVLNNDGDDLFDYNRTSYGRRFIQLRRKNFGGPRVFSGAS